MSWVLVAGLVMGVAFFVFSIRVFGLTTIKGPRPALAPNGLGSVGSLRGEPGRFVLADSRPSPRRPHGAPSIEPVPKQRANGENA